VRNPPQGKPFFAKNPQPGAAVVQKQHYEQAKLLILQYFYFTAQ
jgi:hypothetical protein